MSSENSTDVIRILNLEIERLPDWTFDTCKCEYMHRIGPGGVLMYSSSRYVKYQLPNQGVQVVTLVDAYSLPGIEEVENLVGNTFGFDFVGYGDEVTVNGHTAYLLVVSLKGGSVRGLSLAWHCDKNNVLYMATVVYPSENWDWVDAVEAVSNVKCIHDV